jgi:hypothetical protein
VLVGAVVAIARLLAKTHHARLLDAGAPPLGPPSVYTEAHTACWFPWVALRYLSAPARTPDCLPLTAMRCAHSHVRCVPICATAAHRCQCRHGHCNARSMSVSALRQARPVDCRMP